MKWSLLLFQFFSWIQFDFSPDLSWKKYQVYSRGLTGIGVMTLIGRVGVGRVGIERIGVRRVFSFHFMCTKLRTYNMKSIFIMDNTMPKLQKKNDILR